MLEIINRLFGRTSAGSKQAANDRLRLVLLHDRAAVSPDIIDLIKEDIIQVIQKYLDIDTDALLMHIEKADHSAALVANIPILALRRADQNEAALGQT